MKLSVKMLLLLFCVLLTYCSIEGKTDGKPLNEKDLDKIRLDNKGFDKVKTIHANWYVHSMKALIAQLSRNLLPKLPDDLKAEFVDCLAKIHDKKDLVESSKCVMHAREQYQVLRKWRPRTKKPSIAKPGSEKQKKVKKISIKKLQAMKKQLPEELRIPEYDRPITTGFVSLPGEKIKQDLKITKPMKAVIQLNSQIKKKELLDKKKKVLEMARQHHNAKKNKLSNDEIVSKKMKMWKNERRIELCRNGLFCTEKKADLIVEFKKKWRHVKSIRTKRSLARLVVDSVSKSDGNDHGFFVKNMAKMPSLRTKTKTPIERVTGLLRSFFSNHTESDPSWADTYKALINLKKKMDEKEKESGARVYNERMYDLVLDVPQKDNAFAMFDKKKMPGMMRHAFDLMTTIESSSKNKGDSNIKFLSPRFASVMPDKNENRGRLSPSILSFYNDESEDQILPLPKMLDATGMRGKDRDSILELVMEVSGVKGIVHDSMEMLKSTNMPELDFAMDANAKKSLQMVQDIQKSYNRKQKKEIKNSGFTLMNPLQMEKLMSEQGILGRDDIFNLKEYALMTIGQRKNMVWDMVRGIAFGITEAKAPSNSTTSRVKRQSSVWGPHILAPTVLSPILFTPIFGLNVLGPTVLSPGLFTPLLLNPAVLSPYVFSPTVGIPFILSPYLLSPYVFSPLVMAPFILNPYVLSPNVFNPYVLSPLILSPLVICPDVVSPMTLGGAILSPAVLSPSLLSKSYVMANVLSPTFLS